MSDTSKDPVQFTAEDVRYLEAWNKDGSDYKTFLDLPFELQEKLLAADRPAIEVKKARHFATPPLRGGR